MRFHAYGSSDYGFHNPANGDIKLAIEGSNDASSWTTLYQSLPIRDRVSLV